MYAKDFKNFQERLFGMPRVKEALQQHNQHDTSTAANITEASFLPGQYLLLCLQLVLLLLSTV